MLHSRGPLVEPCGNVCNVPCYAPLCEFHGGREIALPHQAVNTGSTQGGSFDNLPKRDNWVVNFCHCVTPV